MEAAEDLEDTCPVLCLRVSRQGSFNLSAYRPSTERASHTEAEGTLTRQLNLPDNSHRLLADTAPENS